MLFISLQLSQISQTAELIKKQALLNMQSNQLLQVKDQQIVIYQTPALLENSLTFRKDNSINNLQISSIDNLSEIKEQPKTLTQKEALELSNRLYSYKKDKSQQQEVQQEYSFQPQIIEYNITKPHENQRYKQYTLEAQQRRKQMEESKNNQDNSTQKYQIAKKKEQKFKNKEQKQDSQQKLFQSQNQTQQNIVVQPLSERMQQTIKDYSEVMKQSKAQLEKNKQEKIKQERKQCTFKPKINQYKLSTTYEGETIERFEKLERIRQARIKIKQDKQHEKELQECTFIPKINNYKKDNQQPVQERLYALSKKQQIEEEKIDKECTFHPQINEYSQKLVQNRFNLEQQVQNDPIQINLQQEQENEQIIENLYDSQQEDQQINDNKQTLFINAKLKKYFKGVISQILQIQEQQQITVEQTIEQLDLSPSTIKILNISNNKIELQQNTQEQFLQTCIQTYYDLKIKFINL